MDEIRIIHTGDTHLGYRQYQSEVRRQDFMDAFSRVIDDAIDMKVDAVVHAGDLFDSRNPTLDDILGTMEVFSRLKNAGIPLLAIVGNHESKQSTQWLDLYGSMGLVTRLGTTAFRLGDVAIYGIDCVSRSRIPLFDYSVFNDSATDAQYSLLVMHQLMLPFAFGEWDIQEVIDALPFRVDAVLLGDNHKHEIIKVGDAWVTYCGSTERNSISELEPRSYNIVSIGDAGVDISRRIIPTRDFVFIPVHLEADADAYAEIFAAIKEHDIEDKVAFVNISGDPGVKVTFSEVEKFLLSRKALVPGIRDLRTGEISLDDDRTPVSFADPDDAVKEEIRNMNLSEGGLMVDEIIRDPAVVKTKVDVEVEKRLGELINNIDFSEDAVLRTTSMDGVTASGEQYHEVSTDPGEAEAYSDVAERTEFPDKADADQVFPREGPASAGGGSVAQERPLPRTDASATERTDRSSGNDRTVHGKRSEKILSDKSQSRKEKADHKPRQYNLGDYL